MIATDIVKKFQEYLGLTPTSKQISEFSMRSADEVDEILSGTKSEVQAEAAETAQKNIADLESSLKSAGVNLPYQSDYLQTLTKGREALEKKYGLTEAQKRAEEADKFYRDIAMRGPMFEQTMTAELKGVSPKFLGATRKELEEYFANIPNPFVRDRMIDTYLDAADRSLTSTLNALNGLYQTTLIGAQNAVEMEQGRYNKIANRISDLYGDIQWMARNRYQEQAEIRKETRVKTAVAEEALTEVRSDVLEAMAGYADGKYPLTASGLMGTREELIDILAGQYPELTRQQIVNEVYGMTKTLEPEKLPEKPMESKLETEPTYTPEGIKILEQYGIKIKKEPEYYIPRVPDIDIGVTEESPVPSFHNQLFRF